MSHSDEQLEEELRAQVRHVWQNERDNLTVNYIRKAAEEKLSLDEGFLSIGPWKARSKLLIKETVEALENENESPEASKQQSETPVKSTKRKSPEPSPEPAAKRRKQSNAAKKKTLETETSELGSEEEEEGDDESKPVKAKAKPKTNPRGRNAGAKKKKKPSDSEDESELSDVEDTEDSPLSSPPAKGKADSASDGDSSDLSLLEDEPPKTAKRGKQSKPALKAKAKPQAKAVSKTSKSEEPAGVEVDDENAKDQANDSDSSELSSLIDDAPPPKRGKQKKDSATTAAKPKKAAPADDADGAEIKKLQSQLVKCGIRKAWGIELKDHGNDAKAKIRHLRGMLRDVGIDGRFSEQKAREIRERRELMADLEAVTEMNDMWGASSGRPKRGRGKERKPVVDASDSNGEEDNDAAGSDTAAVKNGATAAKDGSGSEEEADVVTSRARGRSRAMADLAFLGDDDEESD